MKKLVLILILFFAIHQSFSYTWESYGPENIKANRLKLFSSEFPTGAICVDSGMYLIMDFYGQDWQYYSYFNMPVTDAVQHNPDSDSILVVMGNGGYSDGIYSFNRVSEEFSVIHYCINPNFIYRADEFTPFYVGYEYGLLTSQDGILWEEVSCFNNSNCIDIQRQDNKIAAAIDQPNNNVFLSADGGENWETISSNFKISEVLFSFSGDLSGICTENTENCGYYEFDEYSMLWDNKFITQDLNTLGFDSGKRAYLGWYNATGEYEGIAKFETEPEDSLIFYNEGLPDLNINDITSTFDYFGADIVFCCTNVGVFYCITGVGIDQVADNNKMITLFPNPVKDKMQITFKTGDKITAIEIYNNHGQKVDESKPKNYTSEEINITWNKGNLPAGVYYLVVKTGKESLTRKFVIL